MPVTDANVATFSAFSSSLRPPRAIVVVVARKDDDDDDDERTPNEFLKDHFCLSFLGFQKSLNYRVLLFVLLLGKGEA